MISSSVCFFSFEKMRSVPVICSFLTIQKRRFVELPHFGTGGPHPSAVAFWICRCKSAAVDVKLERPEEKHGERAPGLGEPVTSPSPASFTGRERTVKEAAGTRTRRRSRNPTKPTSPTLFPYSLPATKPNKSVARCATPRRV